MKLSPISLAVLPLLTVFTANAAVYQIVELDTPNKVRSTSGVAATVQGNIISNGSTFLDVQLDISEIDFDSTTIQALLTEEQLTDAKNGNINTTVAGILINYFISNPAVTNQPIGTTRVMHQSQNGATEQLVLRDTSGTKTNSEFAYAVNDLGQTAGIATAPSLKDTFTQTIDPSEDDEDIPVIPQPYTVWVPEPGYMLGYVTNGVTSVVLPPAFDELGGGMSAAQGINNKAQVTGFTSAGVSDDLQESIEELCNGKLQPEQYCLNTAMSSRALSISNLLSQVVSYQTVYSVSEGYYERAALWQVTDDGSAILNKTWGFLGEKGTGNVAPESEDYTAPIYYSRANAINNDGIAVGHSLYSDTNRKISVYDSYGYEYKRIYAAPHATIYDNDELYGFIDPEEWLSSIAVNINDQNIIAGYALKSINSSVRSRLFVYDMNTGTLKFPNGFFNSSSTDPRDLNNSGQLVGRAEVIIEGTVTRRYHGFIYDVASESFQDLNNLVGCNAPYTLVDATAINDDGVILATALITRPLLGPTGEEQIGADGVVIQQEQATMVKLQPIANGQIDNCNSEEGQYERKSGAVSAFWLMLLGALPLLRRRRN